VRVQPNNTAKKIKRGAMKTILKALVLVLVMGSAALASDYFYTTFQFGYVDHVLPGGGTAAPCGAVGVKGAVAPVVYDGSIWVFYTCNDAAGKERVVARRFFHPNDNAQPPQTSSTPETPFDSGGFRPDRNPCAAYPGFVPSTSGGCVPPNHPLAAK
jgi:hypothetical protein